MNRRTSFHKSCSPMYCMSQQEEELLNELVHSGSIKRSVEICNFFENRQDLKEIADDLLCSQIKCALKKERTIRELVYLFEITPTVGGLIRGEILKKMAQRAKDDPSEAQKLQKLPKNILLSIQGEISG